MLGGGVHHPIDGDGRSLGSSIKCSQCEQGRNEGECDSLHGESLSMVGVEERLKEGATKETIHSQRLSAHTRFSSGTQASKSALSWLRKAASEAVAG
jgi:hypothetical protein